MKVKQGIFSNPVKMNRIGSHNYNKAMNQFPTRLKECQEDEQIAKS